MDYDAVPTEDDYPDHPKMPSDHRVAVLTQTKNKQKNRSGFFSKKSFWLCCSNLVVNAGAHEEEEEKETLDGLNLNNINNKKKMMKRKLLLCCSNVEFETEGEKEKVLSYLEKNTKEYSLMMCCSNIEVGPKTDLGHQTSK
ncbi:hypothetical protein I3842_11G160700 [Carya illinoinensis]|uniref:Uncharacterized protein n=1 Tax=Carya illinoinensis TaxID=32201 RepID=A0A922DR46_CARIL|nr:hypothetical protein I3842_11G160700 [Carya illinoinensis]